MGLFGSDRDRFAKRATRIARELIPGRPVAYDAAEFAIRVGTDTVIYLANTYREHDPADRDHALRRLIGAFTGSHPTAWPQVVAQLRPVLRPAGFGHTGDGRPQPIRRPGLPHLDEYVAIDLPTSMLYVTTAQLAEWGVDADEVFTAARRNLTGLVRPASADYSDRLTHYASISGDEYYPSWLLDTGWLAGLPGTPVVFIAEQNSMLLIDVSNRPVAGLYSMIEDRWKQAVRSLSPVGYTPRGDRFVPYTVPVDHPDAAATSRAPRLLAASVYGQQKHHLDQATETFDDPPYIASLLVVERDSGMISIAPWADQITSWLPEADYIALGAARTLVPFTTVAEALDLQPVPGVTPARYEVGAWPTGAALDVLLAAAV